MWSSCIAANITQINDPRRARHSYNSSPQQKCKLWSHPYTIYLYADVIDQPRLAFCASNNNFLIPPRKVKTIQLYHRCFLQLLCRNTTSINFRWRVNSSIWNVQSLKHSLLKGHLIMMISKPQISTRIKIYTINKRNVKCEHWNNVYVYNKTSKTKLTSSRRSLGNCLKKSAGRTKQSCE